MEAQEPKLKIPEKPLKKKRPPSQQTWLEKMRAKSGFEDQWLYKQAKTKRKLTLHLPGRLVEGNLQGFGFFRINLKTKEGEAQFTKLEILCMATQTNYGLIRQSFRVDEELKTKSLVPEQEPEKRYQAPIGMVEKAMKETPLRFTLLDGTSFVGTPVGMSTYSIYVHTPGSNGRHLIVFKHGLHEVRALESGESAEKDQG